MTTTPELATGTRPGHSARMFSVSVEWQARRLAVYVSRMNLVRTSSLILTAVLSFRRRCVRTRRESRDAQPSRTWASVPGRRSRQRVHEAIGGLRGDGRFTSIMLVVENAPVEMYNVVITFGDGQRFEPGTRITFGRFDNARRIPAAERRADRVDFVFGNIPGDGRAKVELWGR